MTQNETRQVVSTGDGSDTVFHPLTGEHYHSTFGAVTESMHIFIHHGYHDLPDGIDPLHILEIGFGTGLNALLTFVEAEKQHRSIVYEALEPFPLPQKVVSHLNYPGILTGENLRDVFQHLHACPSGTKEQISPRFSLLKIAEKLEETTFPLHRYHLVYFDAFSPNVQPELWQPVVFQKIFAAMKEGGLLLTYCAKGTVSRGLKEAGFTVEKLPGPPGKRHILRGQV